MLTLERQQMIIQLLSQNNSMTVNELSQLCSVSKETLRRDLRVLENKSIICRSHGGAMLLSTIIDEPIIKPNISKSNSSFRQRTLINTDVKTRIARKALQFISPADRIALDSSSTCWFLARQMPNIDMTIITYSINMIQILAAKSQIQIFVLGGVYSAIDEDIGGSITEKMLIDLTIDKLFISCDGLDFNHGLSDNNDHHASLKKKMILSAREVILLIDSTKFNRNSFSKICNLGDIDIIITDQKIDALIQKEMDWHNIKVVIA